MSAPEIVSETAISMTYVKHEIDRIKKRDKELSFRTQHTEEYLNMFSKKDTAKLAQSIKKLSIARLKDEHLVKILDLLPTTVEDLKIILQGYPVTITKDNLKKLVDEVNKFLKS